ncbi:MAG: DUF4278 domain-containing protein [Cyanobacteria bacterium J06626_14]
MQLQFLGVSYASASDIVTTPSLRIAGAYRGHHVAFKGGQVHSLHSATALRYRGISYLR